MGQNGYVIIYKNYKMKTPILQTIKDWSPKQKKARVKKKEFVVSVTPNEISYKSIINDWNSQ